MATITKVKFPANRIEVMKKNMLSEIDKRNQVDVGENREFICDMAFQINQH